MAAREKTPLTAELLRKSLHYDPATGVFTRQVDRGGRGGRAGAIAGTPDGLGRINISIHSVLYKAHRLAWLYMTGEWPLHPVAHLNHDLSDNRWENLRMFACNKERTQHLKRSPEREQMLLRSSRDAERMVQMDLLRERLRYEPDTGELRWAEAVPRESFIDERAWKIWHGKFAGRPVSKRSNGYVVVSVSVNLITYELRGHRVVWALMTGAWPQRQIDHRNGVRDDNRWSNLREATPQQNVWNRGPTSRSKTGVAGVYQPMGSSGFIAQIAAHGLTRHLGSFATLDAAAAARKRAEEQFYGEFARQSDS